MDWKGIPFSLKNDTISVVIEKLPAVSIQNSASTWEILGVIIPILALVASFLLTFYTVRKNVELTKMQNGLNTKREFANKFITLFSEYITSADLLVYNLKWSGISKEINSSDSAVYYEKAKTEEKCINQKFVEINLILDIKIKEQEEFKTELELLNKSISDLKQLNTPQSNADNIMENIIKIKTKASQLVESTYHD